MPRCVQRASAVLADVGVSSPQLDTAERGFSFRLGGPLDMRMDRECRLAAQGKDGCVTCFAIGSAGSGGQCAADIVNSWSEGEIGGLLKNLGEEPQWRKIAAAIVDARARSAQPLAAEGVPEGHPILSRVFVESRTGRAVSSPFLSTLQLSECVARAALGPQWRTRRQPGFHPATLTFQALRIAVNDELGELSRLLEWAPRALDVGGRFGAPRPWSIAHVHADAPRLPRSGDQLSLAGGRLGEASI